MMEPKLEVPAELRDLAEKTIDQAEKAFGMFFDAASQRIYLQGYEGIADVWREVDPDHYVSIGRIQGGVHGKTSLLVYWVHIEFVYGRFSILPKGQCSPLKATGGLIVIFLAMLALSLLRTSWKKRAVSVSR